MDSGKLLKLITDLEKDESQFGLQNSLQGILQHLTSGDADSLKAEEDKLTDNIQRSSQGNFVLTDYNTLKHVGAYEFFGLNALSKLSHILSTRAHQVAPELTKFINERQEVLNKLAAVRAALSSLDIEATWIAKDIYTIGFSLPETYADLDVLEDILGDIKNFLNALANAVNEKQPLRIVSVSNGSIEFYIEASLKLAQHFDTVLDYCLKIYSALEVFSKGKKAIAHLKAKRKKIVEEQLKEELNDQKKEIIDELIQALKILEPETQNSVRMLFNKFLTHLEKGVSAEVRTPSLEEPQPPSPDTDDGKAQQIYQEEKTRYKIKSSIDEKNREMFILQQNNFNGNTILLFDEIKRQDPQNKEEGEK